MSFHRCIIWLSRWNKCRGFGVQSPWAYQMIRYVINEHWPYYAYDEFDNQQLFGSAEAKKLGRFYYRLTNYRQPHVVLNYQDSSIYTTVFKRACSKCFVKNVDIDCLASEPVVELLRMELVGDYERFFEEVLRKVDEQSVIIVENIHRKKSFRKFWKHITMDPRVIITFDLYDCGIIFFQNRRYKENYIVNF